MKNLRLFSRLSVWLSTAVAVIATVPLIGLAVIGSRSALQSTRRTAGYGLAEVARQVAGRIDDTVWAYENLLRGLQETLSRPFLSPAEKKSLFEGHILRFPELRAAALVAPNGESVGSEGPIWVSNAESRAVFRIHRDTDVVGISDLVWREGVLPTVYLSVRDEDLGTLIAELNIARLWQVAEELEVGRTGHVVVLDRKNSIIAHGAAEGKQFILRQDGGGRGTQVAWPRPGVTSEYQNIRGVKVMGAAAYVSSLGWTVIVEEDQSEALAAFQPVLLVLASFSIVLVIAIAVVGIGTSRRLARPLENLVAATQKVGRGDLTVQVPVKGRDERAQLGRAFNEMVTELSHLHDEIAIRERMSVVGRIASELIHDLRHPVRNIENVAHLVTSRPGDPEVYRLFDSVTKREFDGLNRFLRSLEELVSDPEVHYSEVNLQHEVESLFDSLRTTPEFSEIHWHVTATGDSTSMTTDRFILGRILGNLLRNAGEASSKGAAVNVSIEVTDVVRIKVADEGMGIPEDRLATLFDAFKTTKRRGLGLGLAVSKKLAVRIGGTLAASTRKPRGTEFCLELPRLSV